MAKKTKAEKPLNIDDILFKCRDILRQEANRTALEKAFAALGYKTGDEK